MTHYRGRGFTNRLRPPGEFPFRPGIGSPVVSALALDLRRTAGFLVADARGRIVGRVECPMYGTSPETPDALSVRSGFLARRRRLAPARVQHLEPLEHAPLHGGRQLAADRLYLGQFRHRQTRLACGG